jgi:hypothetical protein
MKPVKSGQLNIYKDQIRLEGNKFFNDFIKIGYAMDIIRPIGQPLFYLSEQSCIIFNEQDFKQ